MFVQGIICLVIDLVYGSLTKLIPGIGEAIVFPVACTDSKRELVQ